MCWENDVRTILPNRDGKFVKNYRKYTQIMLLTETLVPVLDERFPDKKYCIGQDSDIYWRWDSDLPERGAEALDWFLVVGVSPTLNGKARRSYVMWKEFIAPVIALEFVSGDGSEERDNTAFKGKFWIYEQALRIPFYGIYEVEKAAIEMYHLVDGTYRPITPNEEGRYVIEPLGVQLGIWHGVYLNLDLPWLRWWDAQGKLLPTSSERAESAEADAKLFAEKLRQFKVSPEMLKNKTIKNKLNFRLRVRTPQQDAFGG